MGGGIGFGRNAQESVKNNRELLNSRKKMKDNPYAASKEVSNRKLVSNYLEIQDWKNNKYKIEKRTSILVFGSILVMVILIIIYLLINQQYPLFNNQ